MIARSLDTGPARRFRSTGLAVAASAFALAVLAAPSPAATTTITPTSIAGASLGAPEQVYRDQFGVPVRKEPLEGSLTRLAFSARGLDVYFATGSDSGIAIVARDARYRTSEGVGPCSTVAALKAAYPTLQPLRHAGRVVAYRLGDLTFVADGGSKVGLVALSTGAVPLTALLADQECDDSSPAQLAAAIASAPSLWQGVEATRVALSRGGVATRDLRTIYQTASSPAASSYDLPTEVVALAQEERHRAGGGRMTLTQLADMLGQFGWEFHDSPAPAEQLKRMLREWVLEARKAPQAAKNFFPLFLDAAAKRQVPRIDLTDPAYDPGDLRLTMLELELMSAAFDRITYPIAPPPPGVAPGRTAASVNPCTDFKKQFGDWGQVFDVGASEGWSKWMETAMKVGSTPEAAEKFSTAMNALSISAKLWKLVVFYANAQVDVSVLSDNPIHKPPPGEKRYAGFKARAGVGEAEWNEYVDVLGRDGTAYKGILRDCLNSLDLPVPADLEDIANDADSWIVDWDIVKGRPKHVDYDYPLSQFDFQNRRGHLLTRVAPYAAETRPMIADVQEEPTENHPGIERTADVLVEASVDGAQPPNLLTLVKAAKGGLGLAESIVELGGGWLQTIWAPSSYATLKVTYHEPLVYELTLQGRQAAEWEADWTQTCSDGSVHFWGDGSEYGTFRSDTPTYGQFVADAQGALDLVILNRPSDDGIVVTRGEVSRHGAYYGEASGHPTCIYNSCDWGWGCTDPPPPDCGTKPLRLDVRVRYVKEKLYVQSANSRELYQRCYGAPTAHLPWIVSTERPLAESGLLDPALERFSVYGEGEQEQTDARGHSYTDTQWRLTFKRVHTLEP
jgi:hypothetical protein